MNAIPVTPVATAHGRRRLRLIIIDSSREYMGSLRRMLALTLPDIEITEYDPDQQGRPAADFDWSIYDAVLLAHELGLAATGLDWLPQLKRQPRVPPIILMTAAGNEYLAARAIKLGAHEYVKKQDIDADRIGDLVVATVSEARAAAQFDVTLREDRAAPHLAILERMASEHVLPSSGEAAGFGYRFVRLIGQGSSSRVYLAERTSDATTLVLKVIDIGSVQDAQSLERFIREAEIVSAIRSPYVVRFYDYGLTQTYGYIAMEFFTRGDLKQRIELGVTVADALNYVRHIALGLAAIHAQGIVHRDLKPGNIMFRADDSIALADFGISKRLNQTSDLTNLGSVIGTPNYLSPEQALGHPVDQRADVYSAGVVLFEMLAGRKPFRAETAAALVYQHVHAAVPLLPPRLLALQPLIDQLLEKDVAARLPTALALVTAIDELAAI